MSILQDVVPSSSTRAGSANPRRGASLGADALARLEGERGFLWGLCYRMTGSSADADDLVQETFVRALERPPPDVAAAWRPWLVRVAMNLGRDALRRRRRRAYPGLWLPTPIETDDPALRDGEPPSDDTPEARYGLRESASFAFVVALEALTPSQRAVLLLRDVFDYSSEETASALDMSQANVRVTLHRARRAMVDYDANRPPPRRDRSAEVDAMLSRMLGCIATRDLDGARSIFASDAVALADGGGVHHVARKRIVGPERIVDLYGDLSTRVSPQARVEVRTLNGLPAIVGEDPAPRKPNAPRWVVLIDLDPAGKIRRLYSIVAPQKIAGLRWPVAPAE